MKWRNLSLVLALGMAVGWWLVLRPGVLGGPAAYISVYGPSMQPTFFTGDLAILYRQADYRVGDIVAYPAEGALIIHRIIGGDGEAGFVMQGDNRQEPDLWEPTSKQVVGRMWLLLPGVARGTDLVKHPAVQRTMAGTVAFVLILGGGRQVQRRRRGNRMVGNTTTMLARFGGLPPLAVATLGALLLLNGTLTAGAIYSFGIPLERTESAERLRYEHQASFAYSVEMAPSLLYPEGLIGPIGGESDQPASPPAPLYTRLARQLNLDFDYALQTNGPVEVQGGEVSADIAIQAEKGWRQPLDGLEPVRFEGSTATAHMDVDLAQIAAFIESVEKETGFVAASYEVAIVPTVHVWGTLPGEPLNDVYRASFPLKLNRTQLMPPAELVQNQVRSRSEPIVMENSIAIFGIALPVWPVRWVTLTGALLTLPGLLFLAIRFLRCARRDTAAQIHARYGSLLVTLAGGIEVPEGPRVQVAALEDLARLAGQAGRPILHQVIEPVGDRYFVNDGLTRYEYVPALASVGA